LRAVSQCEVAFSLRHSVGGKVCYIRTWSERACRLPSAEFSLPRKQILLGKAGERAEMGAAEMGDLRGFPIFQTIATGESFEDPRIDGEGFKFTGPKKQHAVGNFFTDAGQFQETGFRGGVGELFSFVEPTRTGSDKFCGIVNVARSESEQTRAEISFGDVRQLRPSREAVGYSHELRVER